MDWETIFTFHDLKVLKEHECSENYSNEKFVLQCYFTKSKKTKWTIANVLIAGEEEVSDGEAEYVGEVLESNLFIINYCPFCGKKLI